MPEDVVYSDVRFNKKHQSGNGTVSPNQDEVTYSQVRLGAPKSTVGGSSQDDDVTYSQITIGQAQRAHKTTESASQKEEEEVTYSEVRRAPPPVQTSAEKPNRTKGLVIGVATAVLVLAVIGVVLAMTLSGKGSNPSEPQEQRPPPVKATEAPGTSPTTKAPAVTTPTTTTATTTNSATNYTTATITATTRPAPVCWSKPNQNLNSDRCDSGWDICGDTCYYFSNDTLTWNKSREKCQEIRGNLVKIDSTEEQLSLYNRLRSLLSTDDVKFWIGLTDSETEGHWKWTDGSALVTSSYWFINTVDGKTKEEPDDWKGNNKEYPAGEDCVRMGELADGFGEKSWFDQRCDIPNKFICEKHASTPI